MPVATHTVKRAKELHDAGNSVWQIEEKLAAEGFKTEGGSRISQHAKRDAQFVPPDWWPASDSTVEYFASRGVLNGDEGDLYVVAHERQQRRIFIHYYYNF